MRNALASHGFWQAVLSLSVPVIAWFGGAPWPVVVILSAVVLVVVTLGIIHQVTLRRSVHRTAELYHELTGLDLACRGIGLRYYLLCMRRAMHDMARLLAEARQNQALVVDAMMDLEHGVALLDKSGVIQAVNQRGAAMLGLAVGRRLWEEKSGAMALFEIVEKSLKIGQSCSGDFQTVLPEKRWFHLDALALPDGRLLLVFDDMTTTREVAETKSRLVSAVSHELRTPLTVIAGYLEMAQDAIEGYLAVLQEDGDVFPRNRREVTVALGRKREALVRKVTVTLPEEVAKVA